MRQIFASSLLRIAMLALLSIGGAEATQAFVDLALYRPSTGQFFIRSSLNGTVTAIQFGAPGDQGLLCKWHSDTIAGGDNLLVFRNGTWFINLATATARGSSDRFRVAGPSSRSNLAPSATSRWCVERIDNDIGAERRRRMARPYRLQTHPMPGNLATSPALWVVT